MTTTGPRVSRGAFVSEIRAHNRRPAPEPSPPPPPLPPPAAQPGPRARLLSPSLPRHRQRGHLPGGPGAARRQHLQAGGEEAAAEQRGEGGPAQVRAAWATRPPVGSTAPAAACRGRSSLQAQLGDSQTGRPPELVSLFTAAEPARSPTCRLSFRAAAWARTRACAAKRHKRLRLQADRCEPAVPPPRPCGTAARPRRRGCRCPRLRSWACCPPRSGWACSRWPRTC